MSIIGRLIDGRRVELNVDRPGNYVLDVGWIFTPAQRPYQTLRFRLDDHELGEVRIGSRCTLDFFLPDSGILTIDLPDASRPIDMGSGKDTRVLSVGIAAFEGQRRFEVRSGIRVQPRRVDLALRRLGISAPDLAMGVESLGDNCELGMVQREMGADPLGLFRFSSTTPALVIDLLENGFDGLGVPGSLSLSVVGEAREYMVQDSRFGLDIHTWLSADEHEPDKILRQQYKRLELLKRKFLEDARLGEKVFVFRDHGGMHQEAAERMCAALQAIGPSQLLIVSTGKAWSSPRPQPSTGGPLRASIQYKGPDWWMIADTWFDTLVYTRALLTHDGVLERYVSGGSHTVEASTAGVATLLPFVPAPYLDIRFGDGGNGAGFQLTGWSFPEKDFTWSLGGESALRLPPPRPGDDLMLVLHGQPFTREPELREQTVRIRVGSTHHGSFVVEHLFTRSIRLSGSALHQDTLSLVFEYPNASSPALSGSSDDRVLAVAWRRIKAVSVPAARSVCIGTDVVGRQGTASAPSGERGDLPLAPSVPGSESLRNLERMMTHGLRSGDASAAASAISGAFGLQDLSLYYGTDIPEDISVVRCTMRSGGRWSFGFSDVWRRETHENTAASMVAGRLLATLPLFTAYAVSGRLPGSFLLSLGDEAHTRGVAFCANSRACLLIPDPYFMSSFGYRDLRRALSTCLQDFPSRIRVALWRGSSTGYRTYGDVSTLPRVRLCLMAREPGASAFLDVGLTHFAQLEPDEEAQLRRMGLLQPFIDPERFAEWMFHIDIDGNTNSWPGLFIKLLAGGVVLKVTSDQGWRQWYYDRLEPYKHYMPVASDMSDLLDKTKYLAYSTVEAEMMSRAASSLVSSMSYENEVDLALATLEDAVVSEGLLENVQHSM